MKTQELQPGLKEVTQALAPVARPLKELNRLLGAKTEDPLVLHAPLEELSAQVARLKGSLDALVARLDEARKDLAPRLRDRQTTFGADLEDGFKQAGLRLAGRWPRWHSGPWHLEASDDLKTLELQWGPGVEKIQRLPLDLQAALAAVQAQEKAFASAHDGAALPTLLLEATRMAAARLGLRDGEPVPLATVHPCLAMLLQGPAFQDRPGKTTWRQDYSRARFAYDLARLRGASTQDLELRLRVATRDQTRRAGQACWLPDDAVGNGTLFHSIQFVKIGGPQ